MKPAEFDVELPLPPTDANLIALYRELGSVWMVGARVGLAGQTVHKKLCKYGVIKPVNVFGEADKAILREKYAAHAGSGTLAVLAKEMGRTRHFICRQAKALGLTDKSREKPFLATWKYVTEEQAKPIFEEFKKSDKGMGVFCRDKGYDSVGFSLTMRKYFADEWEHVIELKAPKTGLYKIGRAFEYRVRDMLKAAGFFALRSPASRSPLDIMAVRPGEVVMVQCKRGGHCPVSEWNDLYHLAVSSGATPLLAQMAGYRGIQFFKMLGPKDGSKKRQPMEPWECFIGARP